MKDFLKSMGKGILVGSVIALVILSALGAAVLKDLEIRVSYLEHAMAVDGIYQNRINMGLMKLILLEEGVENGARSKR